MVLLMKRRHRFLVLQVMAVCVCNARLRELPPRNIYSRKAAGYSGDGGDSGDAYARMEAGKEPEHTYRCIVLKNLSVPGGSQNQRNADAVYQYEKAR